MPQMRIIDLVILFHKIKNKSMESNLNSSLTESILVYLQLKQLGVIQRVVIKMSVIIIFLIFKTKNLTIRD